MVEFEPRVERKLKYERIGIDFDGVTVRSDVPVIAELNRRFEKEGIKFTREDQIEWDWIANSPKLSFLSEEERKELNYELWNNPEILLAARLRPGVLWALKGLRELGAKLFFPTSREPQLREVTLKQFNLWLPWVKPEQIYIRDEQDSFGGIMLSGRMFKAVVVQRHGLEAFVEDDPDTAVLLAPRTRVLLMKSKLNENFLKTNLHPSTIPVDGWVETYKEIVGFKKYE